MVTEVSIYDIRFLLEVADIKPRKVRNLIVSAIYSGELKQKYQTSTLILPGTSTIENFIIHALAKHKKQIPVEYYGMLTAGAKKLLCSIVN